MNNKKFALLIVLVFTFSLIISNDIFAEKPPGIELSAKNGSESVLSLYKDAEVLSVDMQKNDSVKNSYKKITLIKTGNEYPLVRVEDTIICKDTEIGKICNVVSDSNAMVADHIIVRFKNSVTENEVESFLKENSLRMRKKLNVPGNSYLLIFDNYSSTQSIYDNINELQKNEIVEYAEPDYSIFSSDIPNDPDFHNQWGVDSTALTGGVPDTDIDTVEAWDKTTGNHDVVVGVIDTGIDYNHPDLRDNIWRNPGEIPDNGVDDDGNGFIDDVYGWDFANNDNDPMDDNGHGTHVAGIIGAIGNNGTGITGVNWNVSLAAIKFLGTSGAGTLSAAAEAVNYAVKMGFTITSNSWGGNISTESLEEAFLNADLNNVLSVVAAGNSNHDIDEFPLYPASYNYSSILTVAATDFMDTRAEFSNYGVKSVDIGAPGVDIYSTYPDNSYRYLSGTSMATPFVSGAAALIKSIAPGLSSNHLKALIIKNADKVESMNGITVSGGRLNVNKVLKQLAPGLAKSNPTTLETPAATVE